MRRFARAAWPAPGLLALFALALLARLRGTLLLGRHSADVSLPPVARSREQRPEGR